MGVGVGVGVCAGACVCVCVCACMCISEGAMRVVVHGWAARSILRPLMRDPAMQSMVRSCYTILCAVRCALCAVAQKPLCKLQLSLHAAQILN